MEAKIEYLRKYIGKPCVITAEGEIENISGELAECEDGWIKIKVKNSRYKLMKFSDIHHIYTNE